MDLEIKEQRSPESVIFFQNYICKQGLNELPDVYLYLLDV